MKFNTIISYFFLLLLAFAQIADTSSVTKIARNKLQSLNKSHSHAKSARRANKRSTTLTKKNVMLNDPENTMTLYALFESLLPNAEKIFEFVMGFICEHVTEICEVYNKIRKIPKIWNNVQSCLVTIKDTGNAITGALERSTEETILKVETQGASERGDQRLCEVVKLQIKKTFDANHAIVGDFVGFSFNLGSKLLLGPWAPDISHNVGNAMNSLHSMTQPLRDTDSMCNSFTPDRRTEIIAQFGSLEVYKEQCEYFAKLDCATFNPSTTNMLDFFKKAWGILKLVGESVKCIATAIKEVAELANVYEALLKWLAKLAAEAGFSILANILTLGIWAGIKAVYHFVKLGIRIHKFIVAWHAGNADIFELGRIVANAVNIVKTLLGMRRKRKLMK